MDEFGDVNDPGDQPEKLPPEQTPRSKIPRGELPDQRADCRDPDLANPFPPGYGEDLLGPDANP